MVWVRTCFVFSLALVLVLVYVGPATSLICMKCGENKYQIDCTTPEEQNCENDQGYCRASFTNDAISERQCISTTVADNATKPCTEKTAGIAGDQQDCYCNTDKCNEKSKVTDYANGGGGGGGGSGGAGAGGKGSSSMTKPSVWTNLMWIGLVLASAFYYSRMRAV